MLSGLSIATLGLLRLVMLTKDSILSVLASQLLTGMVVWFVAGTASG